MGLTLCLRYRKQSHEYRTNSETVQKDIDAFLHDPRKGEKMFPNWVVMSDKLNIRLPAWNLILVINDPESSSCLRFSLCC